MKAAVINIKTDPKLKAQAQKVAADLGFSLSSLINGYLRSLTRSKAINFNLRREEPGEMLIKAIREAEEDRRIGRVSPSFDNAKDAIAWLNNPKRKYLNEN